MFVVFLVYFLIVDSLSSANDFSVGHQNSNLNFSEMLLNKNKPMLVLRNLFKMEGVSARSVAFAGQTGTLHIFNPAITEAQGIVGCRF